MNIRPVPSSGNFTSIGYTNPSTKVCIFTGKLLDEMGTTRFPRCIGATASSWADIEDLFGKRSESINQKAGKTYLEKFLSTISFLHQGIDNLSGCNILIDLTPDCCSSPVQGIQEGFLKSTSYINLIVSS
jgi:hypothetical protein